MGYRDEPSERAYWATTWIVVAERAMEFCVKWWFGASMFATVALIACAFTCKAVTAEQHAYDNKRCRVLCHPHTYEVLDQSECYCLPSEEPAFLLREQSR